MQGTALRLYLQAELRFLRHVAATATATFAFVACLTVAAALAAATTAAVAVPAGLQRHGPRVLPA